MTFYKNDHQKREIGQEDETATHKWKMIILKVKFKLNINGVIEKNSGNSIRHRKDPCSVLWVTWQEKRQALFKPLSINFLLNVSNVLNCSALNNSFTILFPCISIANYERVF